MSDLNVIDYGPPLGKTCGHGVHWRSQCIDCEIVWERQCIASAERDLAEHRGKLVMFERIRLRESQAAPDPDKVTDEKDSA